MTVTPQQQLDSVQTAIAALEANPAATVRNGDREVRYADLSVLYAREKDLIVRVKRAIGGGATARKITPRG